MLTALLIMLREGFEAALVVAIVYAYIRRIGRRDLVAPMWRGMAAARLGPPPLDRAGRRLPAVPGHRRLAVPPRPQGRPRLGSRPHHQDAGRPVVPALAASGSPRSPPTTPATGHARSPGAPSARPEPQRRAGRGLQRHHRGQPGPKGQPAQLLALDPAGAAEAPDQRPGPVSSPTTVTSALAPMAIPTGASRAGTRSFYCCQASMAGAVSGSGADGARISGGRGVPGLGLRAVRAPRAQASVRSAPGGDAPTMVL